MRRKQIARLGKCLVPLRHITHILLFLIIAAAAPAQPVVEIETIDGLLTSGTIESINARQVIFQNTLATVQTARMRRMVFLENTRREPGGAGSMVEVRLASGGRLFATDVIIGQLDARVYLSTADQFSFPLDSLKAMRLITSATLAAEFDDAAFETFIEDTKDQDRIIALSNNSPAPPMGGEIMSLDRRRLTFHYQERERTVRRDRLVALAWSDRLPAGLYRAEAVLLDGSVIKGESFAWSDDGVQISLQGGGEISLPWTSLDELLMTPTAMAPLNPAYVPMADVRRRALASPGHLWPVEFAEAHELVQTADRSWRNGFLTHGPTRLVFLLPESFRDGRLAGRVGLRKSARGECEALIRLGDKQVWSAQLRAGAPAQSFSIPLNNAAQVTLQVNPGADLDLGDHVIWADPRLAGPENQ